MIVFDAGTHANGFCTATVQGNPEMACTSRYEQPHFDGDERDAPQYSDGVFPTYSFHVQWPRVTTYPVVVATPRWSTQPALPALS